MEGGYTERTSKIQMNVIPPQGKIKIPPQGKIKKQLTHFDEKGAKGDFKGKCVSSN